MSSGSKGAIHTYKFILIGNAGVGKTVAARGFAEGKPNATTQYKATIGVDYALREFSIGRGAVANVQLWDIAGEQRFGTMTKTYFRGAHAAIIMFDLINMISWEDVDIWRQDVEGKLGITGSANRIPILVVGNKLDLISSEKPSVVTDEALEAYIAHHHLWKYVKLSARTDTMFTDILIELTNMIHDSTPSKPTSSSEIANGKGSLKVIPSSSPKQKREIEMKTSTDSAPRSRSNSTVTSTPPSASDTDQGGVYTLVEENSSSSGKESGCCVIS